MKKRIFILFLCVVFATSALLIPAAAAETEEGYWTYNDVVLPELPENLMSYSFIESYYRNSDGMLSYSLYTLSRAVSYSDSYLYFNKSYTSWARYLFVPGDGDVDWVLDYSGSNSSGYSQFMSLSSTTLVWSNFDILDDSDSSVYFSGSEPVFMIPPAPVLPGRLEGVKMTEVLKQIVMILPIVLVCLVGWIALRKGLALLVQLLRKA